MDESNNILVGLALFLPFVVIVLFLANKQNKEKLEAVFEVCTLTERCGRPPV